MWLSKKEEIVNKEDFVSYKKTFLEVSDAKLNRTLLIILCSMILFTFLPWTQTIQGNGIITTRTPEQRQQELNSVIAGRIAQWNVKEGDYVKKGDTILKLTEIKETYLDPKLLLRTEEQIKSKEATVDFYRQKVTAIQNQANALYQARDLKLEQIKNKINQCNLYIENDSMLLIAAISELKIAKDQLKRQEELYKNGLKSLTELEQRRQSFQNAESKKVVCENKLTNAKNDLLNTRIEMNSVEREYSEKIAKITSEKFSTLSEITSGEGEISKLKNQFSNYAIRNGFYFLLAPQDGQITKTIKAGIGEIIKEGEQVAKIVPVNFQYAVEMYVKPVDLPLISLNQKVRFQFDGWPSIFFSGWQNISYGTYGGKVVAIDNSISDNGKFRILVAEDDNDTKWPTALKAGGGAKGVALLTDVPIWYELWRNMNGFPPNFYESSKSETKNVKK